MCTRLTAYGVLEGFIKKGVWQVNDTELLWFDRQEYEGFK